MPGCGVIEIVDMKIIVAEAPFVELHHEGLGRRVGCSEGLLEKQAWIVACPHNVKSLLSRFGIESGRLDEMVFLQCHANRFFQRQALDSRCGCRKTGCHHKQRKYSKC